MCGSGTIAIEAAMKAKNIAPGLRRRFAMENWNSRNRDISEKLRAEARDGIIGSPDVKIHASDIDVGAVEAAKRNARKAGVDDIISFSAGDVRKFRPDSQEGTIIINPPYAIRLESSREIDDLYAAIGRIYRNLPGFRFYAICADEEFAKKFGTKEDSKRKLYNGNIKCYLYQYFKRRTNGKE
jgi:putative N6-adenine-specific DNA methylase